MVRSCLLCRRHCEGNLRLFQFPVNNPRKLNIWLSRLGISASSSVTSRTKICSDNFEEKDITRSDQRTILARDAVPTVACVPHSGTTLSGNLSSISTTAEVETVTVTMPAADPLRDVHPAILQVENCDEPFLLESVPAETEVLSRERTAPVWTGESSFFIGPDNGNISGDLQTPAKIQRSLQMRDKGIQTDPFLYILPHCSLSICGLGMADAGTRTDDTGIAAVPDGSAALICSPQTRAVCDSPLSTEERTICTPRDRQRLYPVHCRPEETDTPRTLRSKLHVLYAAYERAKRISRIHRQRAHTRKKKLRQLKDVLRSLKQN